MPVNPFAEWTLGTLPSQFPITKTFCLLSPDAGMAMWLYQRGSERLYAQSGASELLSEMWQDADGLTDTETPGKKLADGQPGKVIHGKRRNFNGAIERAFRAAFTRRK